MASSGKKKTTMAKLARESRLRERRQDKQAKKDARKFASVHGPHQPPDTVIATVDESARTGALLPAPHNVVQPPADADPELPREDQPHD